MRPRSGTDRSASTIDGSKTSSNAAAEPRRRSFSTSTSTFTRPRRSIRWSQRSARTCSCFTSARSVGDSAPISSCRPSRAIRNARCAVLLSVSWRYRRPPSDCGAARNGASSTSAFRPRPSRTASSGTCRRRHCRQSPASTRGSARRCTGRAVTRAFNRGVRGEEQVCHSAPHLTRSARTAYLLCERIKGAGGFARRAKPTFQSIDRRHIHRRAACCEPRLKHGGRMSTPLPERANLEQLKKQAKSLLHAAQGHDAAALQRFAALPAFAALSAAALGAAELALHDAQSVIAREHGFASWNALREEVEARTLSFEAAVDEFVRCATDGALGRAQRLLALHPRIAHASLQTEIVLGDAAAVEARLRD